MSVQDEINSLIEQIATLRGTSVVLFYIPGADDISESNWLQTYMLLRDTERFEKLDIVVYSHGGDLDAAYKIASLFRRKTAELSILVPYMAKSAAAFLTLNADNIILAPNAELGPLDAQVPHPRDPHKRMSALDGFKTLEFLRTYALETLNVSVYYFLDRGLLVNEAIDRGLNLANMVCNPLLCQMDPILLGEYDRILQIAMDYGHRLLRNRMNPEDASTLLEMMIRNYPSHSFVIDVSEAQTLGLPCTESDETLTPILNTLFLKLNEYGETLITLISINGDIEDGEEEDAE